MHQIFFDFLLTYSAFQDRYYEAKFGIPPDDPESESFRQKVAAEYTLGLCWVLRYYYQVSLFRHGIIQTKKSYRMG